jgi:asparagine synthase (glutamine-hydrolysing)
VGPQTTLERHLDWVTADRRHRRPALYGPRLGARAYSDVALRSLESHLNGFLDEFGTDAFMQLDQRHWLPDDVLFKVDRAGMMNSLEIRAPYLARDVAEFANSVAAGTHLAGRGKALLRTALGKVLPNQGVRRRKIAFRVPGEEWLRGPLRNVLDQQVRGGTLVSEGLIDRDFIAVTAREHAAGLDRTAILWPLLSLGLWLDRYMGASEP